MNTIIRTYSELITIPTFEERFEYLKLNGTVGEDTFGFDRYINQQFYTSPEWRAVRNDIIVRDYGCDLGIRDREIPGLVVVHHMNPIDVRDIVDVTEFLMNPEFLITTADITHKAIHYGDENLLIKDYVPRRPNDTIPWR